MTTTWPTKVRATDVCVDIGVLTLERPERYDFAAGQWLRLTLETAEGAQTKTFSIASGPGDRELVLATRRSDSAFKQAWFALGAGDDAVVSAPGGRLTLPDDPRFVFLAGGVGITPVRGLLRGAIERGRDVSGAGLVYANRSPECTPFLAELDRLTTRGMQVLHVFERDARPGDGQGLIAAELLGGSIADAAARTYIVTGPPVMVGAMEGVLDDLGVPQGRRLVERFGALPR